MTDRGDGAQERPTDVGVSLGDPVEEAPPLRQQVYERMRNSILSGDFPAGSRLSPVVLAKTLGVSTMPVREAIRLLEDDGLVETSARRWTRVVAAGPGLADDVYPLVGLLEGFAVEYGEVPNRSRLARLRAANRELQAAGRKNDVVACMAADTHFHSALVEGSSNEILLRTIDDLKARIRLLEGAFFRAEQIETSVAQHEEIIAALGGRDLALGAEIVRRNWEYGLAALHQALAPPAPPSS